MTPPRPVEQSVFTDLYLALRQAFRRFPQSIIVAGALDFLLVASLSSDVPEEWLLTLAVALTWSLLAEAFVEGRPVPVSSLLVRSIALLPAIATGISLVDPGYAETVGGALVAVVGFFLALSLPLVRRSNRDFWRFHLAKSTSVLWGATVGMVLFAGVRLALLALEELVIGTPLFGRDITGEIFFLAALAGFVVVLGRLPSIAPESQLPEPNRAWEKATLYLAMPLSFLYLLILYLFLARIALEWEWPEGYVGWMVLSFSSAALGTWLLSRPYEFHRSGTEDAVESDGRPVMLRRYRSLLMPLVIPILPVVLLAFRIRIVEYGLTEPRVLGLMIAVWFLLVAMAFSVRPSLPVAAIPLSLGLLIVPLVFGPLNPTNLAVADQADRLEMLLRQDVTIDDAQDDPRIDELAAEIRSVGWFLEGRDALDEVLERRGLRDRYVRIASALWPGGPPREIVRSHTFQADPVEQLSTGGFDWVIPIHARNGEFERGSGDRSIAPGLVLSLEENPAEMVIRSNTDTITFDLLDLPFEEANGHDRIERAVLRDTVGELRAAFYGHHAILGQGGRRVVALEGYLLVGGFNDRAVRDRRVPGN